MTTTFNATSTATEVLAEQDLRNKRILITGISSGIGFETASALIARGANVVGSVRDAAAVADSCAAIEVSASKSGGKLEVIELDLGSLASVRASADRLIAAGRKFDVIIANAGVMATPERRTADGFELQLGVNHLGHFVLINRLGPLINEAGRVVVLSSTGHRAADVDFDDPNFDRGFYDRWIAYGRSKTANALFAVEFDRRYRKFGVRACSVMPGASVTPLVRYLSQDDLLSLTTAIESARKELGLTPLQYKTPAQAAATTVWAAFIADGEEIGGRYLEDCAVAEVDERPGFIDGVMPYAVNPDQARRFWQKSEELVAESFRE
ncbi:SDR family NAD(P)-dependent oxidoreductase [Rhizobium leguminosarum]|uniref:SDR family NAD(P)-dependent oxidoreductase n=1 Tax=Rhizobium TaxID=379 RepID=UPI00103170A5|nr:SDR family NAD(P)-dependent oxidoreductase [Rhizobium leguminosarum]TBF87531.1 SDR family NAD(P)-dependent oxidoreductase [Rhizobium leguminosarum]TBG07006.1 SDR family NAD(P)-dependent oxidoreductase [Rhizobium leguminosarum]TBG07879.1 SDR family NAD(P)-dependent oxidoreductase [Rhizobium leguminosarum]TBG30043.1 SDR family NAD(P)-dependent oxidoreductase [Rhizobium leguminosarum]TBG50180.1 SDR family NAD(P)-dependent oxidoreductase [Rhizobium leguminosarum]